MALRDLATEIVQAEQFDALVARAKAGEKPRAYIGFEPSGTAHVGWIVCAETVTQLVNEGFHVIILLADWHAQINDKLGGDMAKINTCAQYMQDCFKALGVPDAVEYKFASELAEDPAYWALVVQVAKATTLKRMRRAMTIMGRGEDEADGDMSKFLYPAMQVADIFYMNIDLAYGGMDQRHAHMLARDAAKRLGQKPPVAFHTPLVPNLKGGAGRMDPAEAKMSKSDPSSGIFLHDEASVVKKKLGKAHCPAGDIGDNPVMDLLRMVVFTRMDTFRIDRPDKFGGPMQFANYAEVAAAFESGDLHPADLKSGVADAMNEILAPVHAYFNENPRLLAQMREMQATR